MNYGGIGVTIGHEIIHGFDDLGRQFDKHGNMVDWWESASEANFIERVECIRNQYNNYILEFLGKNVSRRLIKLIINSIELINFCFEGDGR